MGIPPTGIPPHAQARRADAPGGVERDEPALPPAEANRQRGEDGEPVVPQRRRSPRRTLDPDVIKLRRRDVLLLRVAAGVPDDARAVRAAGHDRAGRVVDAHRRHRARVRAGKREPIFFRRV